MSLSAITQTLSQFPDVAAARAALAQPGAPGGTVDAVKGLWPSLIAGASESGPVLAVTATGREAEELAAALSDHLPAAAVAVFPSWETLPHERLSPRSDTVGQRLSVLRRLAHPGPGGELAVVVAPVRAVLQPIVTGLGELEPVELRVGAEAELDALAQRLAGLAYSRVDMVSRRGEFAVRGGILDIFPPTSPHALRVEFFGDEVDEIRPFSVSDQRSLAGEGDEPVEVWAPPVREVLLTAEVRERARSLASQVPAAQDMLLKIADGIAVEGMESLAPVLAEGMEPLLARLPAATRIVITAPEKVGARAEDLVSTTDEFLAAAWTTAASGGQVPIDLSAASFRTLAQTRQAAEALSLPWWELGGFSVDEELADPDATICRIGARQPRGYAGDVEAVLADVRQHLADEWTVYVLTEGRGPGERLVEVFSEAELAASFVPDLEGSGTPATITVTTAAAFAGFVFDDRGLAVLTEAEVLGRAAAASTRDMRRLPARRKRNQVDPLDLAPGDFVVHEQHGVGRFVELVQRTTGRGEQARTREYLVVEYAPAKRGQPGDRLYVPSDSLDQVTRYVGGEDPALNKMGGSDWAKTKSRARKAVKDIAGELVRLYSARRATRGHAFGPDTPWQRELEDAFHYVETPDQLTTIDEVKADMEKEMPMDRLISGDVGYGKTEVAVRAAFKAIQEGKQVAVLVPTTLLVQQHYETFTERYAGFPVTVAALSRFQTAAQSKQVMANLAAGKVDLVIGTHRLLSGEVRFKDLGLVIIDEEQRFGVEHKETLTAMRTNVDVLAMSATPIPRTLEMAVTGIREMSTLATPPEERHPVLTYVGRHEDRQVSAAIRRELMREGQVFYIHNRVQDIERVAAHLAELVPEARIAVAHGKMSEQRLEQVIVDFWEKRFDVLVCTTIVETGIDIANANTLIVDRADRFGLSQLHQLRGRVGRGRERAYAYFLYPADTELTETAHDRLTTLAAHTELGAGMQVAMKDLEIRGAGNLLGGQQSGHIEGVGFDLYVRMVGEAVANFKGEGEEEVPEMRVELPIDAHLPVDYVEHERLRLEAYRKLAAATSEAEIAEVLAELTDRYGPYPPAVEVLADIARLRIRARASGVSEIVAQGNMVRFGPVELVEWQVARLKRLHPKALIKPAVRSILVPKPKAGTGFDVRDVTDAELIAWCTEVLDQILPLEDEAASA